MRILIVTPAAKNSTKGNRITADRWAGLIRKLGHHVTVEDRFAAGGWDVLIALHARKSSTAVARFKQHCPNHPVVIAMTGTDLHLDMNRSPVVRQTLALADRIILLEPEGGKILDPEFQTKTCVIYQSSKPLKRPPPKLKRCFEVSVLGHLRDVKDPFRTAKAATKLPDESRIKIVHFGKALTRAMERLALKETETNPRYRWLGPVSHTIAKRRLARSHLTVLSSIVEGAPAVISESVVNNVPILATRIPATIGLLGTNYPGFFEVGDTDSLAKLLYRAESDQKFYLRLLSTGKRLKSKFLPGIEMASWKSLLGDVKRFT